MQGRKHVLFEKKKQKTSALEGVRWQLHASKQIRVFWFFFLKKNYF
jgi:hypothetical protein